MCLSCSSSIACASPISRDHRVLCAEEPAGVHVSMQVLREYACMLRACTHCLCNLLMTSFFPRPSALNNFCQSFFVTSSCITSNDWTRSAKPIPLSLLMSNMSNPSSGLTSLRRRAAAMASTAGDICSGLRSVGPLRGFGAASSCHMLFTTVSSFGRYAASRHSGCAFRAERAPDSRARMSNVVASSRSPSSPTRPPG